MATTTESPLTDAQALFIDTFHKCTKRDPYFTGKKFALKRLRSKKFALFGKVRIPINLADKDLFELAGWGYIQLFSSPPGIIFTPKALEHNKEEIVKKKSKEKEAPPPEMQVFRINVIQVYAWLVASLFAASFSLFLLWLTFQQIVNGSISATVATAISTLVTSLLSGVFFKNYDKANERLKNTRVEFTKEESTHEIIASNEKNLSK